ncbi:MAG: sigma-70 family RNA polymerase sigma factor [Saprospiraceae bacterium]
MKKNDSFLTALRLNEEWAFEELYKDYYPMVLKYVLNNSGNHDDAKDLFQNVIIGLIKNVRNPDFELYEGTKFGTYLMSIAQKMWLASLVKTKNKKETVDLDDINLDWRNLEDDFDIEDKEVQFKRMESALDNIGKECKEIILNFYYNEIALGKIADIMGYTQGFIRVKKNRCMNKLKDLITNR